MKKKRSFESGEERHHRICLTQTSCDSAEVIELAMKASSFTKSASCQIRFLIRPRIWGKLPFV